MDQSANDWHTRSPPFSFVPVQHYVAAYSHGHHPESMPAFALLLNVQCKPTTWAPHTIPYHIPFPDVQWTSGPMRQCPCRCTRIMALHTNVQQMLVQKTNMHAVTAKKQNKYTLHTVPNVRSKSKYARTKLLCPAA